MFIVYNKEEDGFTKIILKDELSGTYVEVIPACGAILHSFTVAHNSTAINVIDSYIDIEDFKNNMESNGFAGCKLSPFACRLNQATYTFAQKKYKIKKLNLPGVAVHGLIYDQAFLLDSQNATEEKAFVKMKYKYKATDAGYPFYYDCIVSYQLEKENKLSVVTEVINRDEQSIPIQDGWHSYFKLGAAIDELELKFQSGEMLEFTSELIPTGAVSPYTEFQLFKKIGGLVLDNTFTLNFAEGQPLCVLKNADKKIEVEIQPDQSYPYLHLYTPFHRKSIALEVLSAAPDSFNNKMGLKTLSPAESTTFKTSYKIILK